MLCTSRSVTRRATAHIFRLVGFRFRRRQLKTPFAAFLQLSGFLLLRSLKVPLLVRINSRVTKFEHGTGDEILSKTSISDLYSDYTNERQSASVELLIR
jgi:hypothetical protein